MGTLPQRLRGRPVAAGDVVLRRGDHVRLAQLQPGQRAGGRPDPALPAGRHRLSGPAAGDAAVRVALPCVAGVTGTGAGGGSLRTWPGGLTAVVRPDRKSTRLNSSHY